jgi:hypothetical protein
MSQLATQAADLVCVSLTRVQNRSHMTEFNQRSRIYARMVTIG